MEKAPDAKNWFGPKTVEDFVRAPADRVLCALEGPREPRKGVVWDWEEPGEIGRAHV